MQIWHIGKKNSDIIRVPSNDSTFVAHGASTSLKLLEFLI